MNPLFPNCIATKKTVSVPIPNHDGSGIAETIQVEIDVWRDPVSGDEYLDGHARAKIENAKARHMGLLSPEQIKELRVYLHLKQREMAELLQIGEKTWTRWETGRERPSRSMNVLLNALYDGRIDINYLNQLRLPRSPRFATIRTQVISSLQAQPRTIRWTAPDPDWPTVMEEGV